MELVWKGQKCKDCFSASSHPRHSLTVTIWPPSRADAIHLGYEDGSHRFIKGRTIHVNGRSDWQDKSSHTLIDPRFSSKQRKVTDKVQHYAGQQESRVMSTLEAGQSTVLRNATTKRLFFVPVKQCDLKKAASRTKLKPINLPYRPLHSIE